MEIWKEPVTSSPPWVGQWSRKCKPACRAGLWPAGIDKYICVYFIKKRIHIPVLLISPLELHHPSSWGHRTIIWFSKSSNLPRVMRSPQAKTPASATWNISHNICQKFVSNSTHLAIPLDNLNQVFQIISHTPHLKIPFFIVFLQNHFNDDFNTLSSCSWSSTITKLARLCSTTYRTASGLFVVYMPEKKLFVISAVSVYWQNLDRTQSLF